MLLDSWERKHQETVSSSTHERTVESLNEHEETFMKSFLSYFYGTFGIGKIHRPIHMATYRLGSYPDVSIFSSSRAPR